MIGTFPGKLTLVEGDEVDVDLEIAGGRLRLTTGVSEIGAWPLDACLVTTRPIGGYELFLDGERVSFVPDHPDAFSAVVARMVPVDEPKTFDLEAALDQVLGGPGGYEVPGLADESVDDIAVTLEALFATAFNGFDGEALDDEPIDQPALGGVAAPASGAEDLTGEPDPVAVAAEDPTVPAASAVVESDDRTDEVLFFSEPEQAVEEPPAPFVPEWVLDADPTSEVVDPLIDPLIDPVIDSLVDPVIDSVIDPLIESAAVAPEPQADAIVPPFEAGPDAETFVTADAGAAADAGVAEFVEEVVQAENDETHVLEGVVEQPLEPSNHRGSEELGARWRPGSRDMESDEVVDEDVVDEQDEDVESEDDGSREDSEESSDGIYAAAEPEDPDDATPYRNGFGRYPSESGSDRGYHDPDQNGSGGSHPSIGHMQDSEFDLDHAAARAGYGMPGDIEADDERDVARVPARRGIGGMFSKSAGERFSAVAGAMRERSETDEGGEDTGLSVADQIRASQEQLRSGSRVVRFTPALVRKVAIVMVVLFVLGGIGLLIPTVVDTLAERVETAAEAPRTETTVSATPTTAPAATTVPVDEPGSIVPPSTSVFELGPDEFTMLWNTTAGITSSLAIDSPPDTGPFGLGFTRYAGLEGVVGEGGTIDSYTVVIDPLGDPLDDQLGIQALGVAIKVAEPAAGGSDLSAILLEMGLDVTNPTIESLGGSVTRGRITYALSYDAGRQLIRLAVTPTGAVQPAEEEPES